MFPKKKHTTRLQLLCQGTAFLAFVFAGVIHRASQAINYLHFTVSG